MKQQQLEKILKIIINEHTVGGKDMDNYITKARILVGGGNQSASVEKELMNGFEPRDPENMSPYGAQNHLSGIAGDEVWKL